MARIYLEQRGKPTKEIARSIPRGEIPKAMGIVVNRLLKANAGMVVLPESTPFVTTFAEKGSTVPIWMVTCDLDPEPDAPEANQARRGREVG